MVSISQWLRKSRYLAGRQLKLSDVDRVSIYAKMYDMRWRHEIWIYGLMPCRVHSNIKNENGTDYGREAHPWVWVYPQEGDILVFEHGRSFRGMRLQDGIWRNVPEAHHLWRNEGTSTGEYFLPGNLPLSFGFDTDTDHFPFKFVLAYLAEQMTREELLQHYQIWLLQGPLPKRDELLRQALAMLNCHRSNCRSKKDVPQAIPLIEAALSLGQAMS